MAPARGATPITAVRAAYDAQARAVGEWLRSLPTDAWERPSALPGWSVRELAYHLSEVPGALTRPLAAGPVGDAPLTVAGYTAAWPAAAADIADRARAGARDRSPVEVLAAIDAANIELRMALDAENGDPVVGARRGPIRLRDLLRTRVDELVVHSRDLSASLPERDPVPLDRDALGVAVRMLLEVLTERVPGRAVEVRVPPYAAVQCVAGPRHTRGTPPNVVEADPLTWVELAAGRLAWAEAVAAGRVSASGERADLAAYLPVIA